MDDYESLSHTTWTCKYHVVFIPKCRRKVSQAVEYIKGKSAVRSARVYSERKRNFAGQHFWARGFFVNTVGRRNRQQHVDMGGYEMSFFDLRFLL